MQILYSFSVERVRNFNLHKSKQVCHNHFSMKTKTQTMLKNPTMIILSCYLEALTARRQIYLLFRDWLVIKFSLSSCLKNLFINLLTKTCYYTYYLKRVGIFKSWMVDCIVLPCNICDIPPLDGEEEPLLLEGEDPHFAMRTSLSVVLGHSMDAVTLKNKLAFSNFNIFKVVFKTSTYNE